MNVALGLGRRGQGHVWPWPSVGCVIVKDCVVVGRGVSDKSRVMHAEAVALEQAGAKAKGATVYVTLEPCAHYGTTPPCANALVDAGVARVVSACDDPNPLVAGKGYDILQSAGIQVVTDVLSDVAQADNMGFLLTQTSQRPMVTLKIASSLDGRIATRSGESQWITGPEARREVHAMRARHDAVMVGGGTAREDNPMLNVRGMGEVPQPVRIVVSRDLNVPLDSNLARSAETQPLWILHAEGADTALWQNADCIACATDQHGVDILDGLKKLASKGLTRVFCEGGGALSASLLKADVVDNLVVMSAGLAIGNDGTPLLGSLGVEKLGDAPRFDLIEQRKVGCDVVSRWQRR